MKSKDLIKLIQQKDPTGEMECCIGNADIYLVYSDPSYWDGCLEVLERDKNNPYYNVTGARFTSKGVKLVLQPLSIRDAVFNDENLPVQFDDYTKNKYEKLVEEWRKESRKVNNSSEKSIFMSYIEKRYFNQENFDEEILKEAASKFYDENMSYLDEMPKDILTKKIKDEGYIATPSWAERRREQWEREISLDVEDGKPFFKKELKKSVEILPVKKIKKSNHLDIVASFFALASVACLINSSIMGSLSILVASGICALMAVILSRWTYKK